MSVPCGSTESCSGGVCVSRVCAPGTVTCSGIAGTRMCGADGLGYSDAPCPSGEDCSGGACRPRPCASTAAFSDDWEEGTADPRALALGDLDGDARDELAIGYVDGTVRIASRRGDTWTVIQTLSGGSATGDVGGLRFGDADGDGDRDLLVAYYLGGPVRVFRNAGGVLSVAWTSTELEDHGRSDWGDYDGDGDLDFAVSVGSGGRSRVYRNDGAFNFTSVWVAPMSGHAIQARWADLDGDSDVDLLIGMAVPESSPGARMVSAFRNDGGTLTSAWSNGAGSGYVIDTADYDGDGDVDLAVADFVGGVRLFRNDGAFVFTAGPVYTDCLPHSVAWRPESNGRRPSLAVSCQGGTTRLLDVVGSTLTETWTSVRTSSFGQVVSGEVNGDGVTDLVSSGATTARTNVYVGDCGALRSTVLRFDGDGDGVLLPTNPAYGDIGGAFTIEMWFRPALLAIADFSVLYNRRANLGDYALLYSRGSDGRVRFEVYTDTSSLVSVVSTGTPTIGEWHHVAGVVEGRSVRLYVDGVLQGSSVATSDITWRAGDSRATEYPEYATFIGYTRSPGDGGAPRVGRFGGDIDDVRISRVARYSGSAFGVPGSPWADPSTVALWTFEEASGTTALDTGPSGALDGTITGAVRVPLAR
jgi:hypothetical protein